MRLDRADEEVVEVALSERNLRTLLAKLAGYPSNSACTILRQGDPTEALLIVRGEPDALHYGSRGYGPGEMDARTEQRIGEQIEAERHRRPRSDETEGG